MLEGHTGLIYAVAISPDGAQAITCSVDKSLRIWDLTRGSQTRAIENLPAGVWSVSYSRDGKQIAIGLHDNRVQIRARTTWNSSPSSNRMPSAGSTLSASITMEQKSPPPGCPDGFGPLQTERVTQLKGHSDEVTCIDFSPDGSRVMTGAGDNTARLWNAAKGGDSLKILQQDARVNCVRFNSDGTRVVTGGTDNIGRVWNLNTGEVLFTLEGHTEAITTADYSPDDTRIVTGSNDFTTRIWDASNGQQLATLEGHTDEINSAVFSRDGKRIVTGSRDRTARIWEAAPWHISDYPGEDSQTHTCNDSTSGATSDRMNERASEPIRQAGPRRRRHRFDAAKRTHPASAIRRQTSRGPPGRHRHKNAAP